MKDYSDYMDDELPIPENTIKKWFQFVGILFAFVVIVLSVALVILNIFSNPK